MSFTTGVQLAGVASERNEHGSRQTDPSIVTEDEGWQWEQSSFLFDMGEDNGLLGVGALSTDFDSARHSSTSSVDALDYAKWRDPYEPNGLDHEIFSSTISCDRRSVSLRKW